MVEELFTKLRQEFGEFNEESRKVDELRVLEQGGKTVDKYVQEFKRAARESGYEGRALVEEFKRGLSGISGGGWQRQKCLLLQLCSGRREQSSWIII